MIASALSLVIAFSHPAGAASPAAALQDAFAEVAAKAKPAVVNISVTQDVQLQTPNYFFGDPEDMFREFMQPRQRHYRAQGTGSGFIIDPKGYVLTNEHVIRGATDIRIVLTQANGKDKSYIGKVIGRDPNVDLAVVKIQAKESFPYLALATKPPKVGHWAIAIGSPFALEQTLTVGVVSAERQSLQIENRRYPNMIQTDAAINRGNSGGPLLNLDGEVIGVNTAIYSPSGASAGIGFAIPAAEVKSVLNYLLAGKRMRRGWMGVEAAPVDDVIKRRFGLPSGEGALVNKVMPNSPAAKAGLKRGDVIRKFNGDSILDPGDLVNATSKTEAGKRVALQVYRQGAPIDVSIVLGERPAEGEEEKEAQAPGEQQEKPETSANYVWEDVTFSQQEDAIVVAQVDSESPLAGYLVEGDVIRGVNTHEVASLKDLKAATKAAKVADGVFFDILRQGQPRYISVKP